MSLEIKRKWICEQCGGTGLQVIKTDYDVPKKVQCPSSKEGKEIMI